MRERGCVGVLETALGTIGELRSLALRDCGLEADLGPVVAAAKHLHRLDIGELLFPGIETRRSLGSCLKAGRT